MTDFVCSNCLDKMEEQDFATPPFVLTRCSECGWQRHLNVEKVHMIMERFGDVLEIDEEELKSLSDG